MGQTTAWFQGLFGSAARGRLDSRVIAFLPGRIVLRQVRVTDFLTGAAALAAAVSGPRPEPDSRSAGTSGHGRRSKPPGDSATTEGADRRITAAWCEL
jgi:hypothetical protein